MFLGKTLQSHSAVTDNRVQREIGVGVRLTRKSSFMRKMLLRIGIIVTDVITTRKWSIELQMGEEKGAGGQGAGGQGAGGRGFRGQKAGGREAGGREQGVGRQGQGSGGRGKGKGAGDRENGVVIREAGKEKAGSGIVNVSGTGRN